MSEAYTGEIRMFAGTFAPREWAFCEGQTLSVVQNQALFSLIGNKYGGDGRTTFALPDMRGRIPLNQGTGPGLSPRNLAQKDGSPEVTLEINQMPAHEHRLVASTEPAANTNPSNMVYGVSEKDFYNQASQTAQMGNAIGPAGGNDPHSNMMPYLAFNFIICLNGTYPSRN